MVSAGLTGAFAALTCNPTVTFCPAASFAVQSEPVQVTDVFGTTVHFIPQELATEVTVGSFQDTDHDGTARSAVRSRFAT